MPNAAEPAETTLTLTDFLLARIAEDEAEIGAPFGHDDRPDPNGLGWAEVGAISEVLMISAHRARAECEAKRRIVEYRTSEGYADDGMVTALRALASVYADHPDYRAEWRP